MVRACWKQFAASAIAFADKYRYDVFYRTGWNVVLLQVGFTVLVLFLVLMALSTLYSDIVERLIASLSALISSGGIPSEVDVRQATTELEYAKQKNMILAATGMLMLAALFGYLITRLALTPTRNALKSQKQFVGNIAHELRTPLSILKTNTEVALMGDHLTPDLRETLLSNTEELDRISGIINNLLSMNRLLRPEKIAFEDVDTGPCVSRVTSALADLAERKNITVTTHVSDMRTVRGSPAAIEQILMNITKNALNYTPQNGTVSIAVEPDASGTISITVEDTGTGIEASELEKIFEPFYRGDSSRNRKSGGGSGLGLAIVNELVKLHNGSIEISSVVGVGTRVVITLPRGRGKPRGRPKMRR